MMDKTKKAVIIFSVFLILSVSAVINIYAESIWEGSAAMGRYGEFPMSGYYGASNSFPQNAFVEVENLESGKKTRLIIVDRLSNSGLLMLVSNEAAQELGIYQNDISRVKIRILSSAVAEHAVEYDDLAYNPDPDINPAASFTSPEELAYRDIENTPAVTEPETAEEPEVAETPVEVPADDSVVETVEESETEAPVYIEIMPPVTDELAEAEARIIGEEVPKIAADAPEKPFDWPDTVIEEPEPESEPLYLTMDNLDEGLPAEEGETSSGNIPAPETLNLWPDDEIAAEQPDPAAESEPEVISEGSLAGAVPADSADGVTAELTEVPEAELELIFSGLSETEPAYSPGKSLTAVVLPEIFEKQQDEGEYVTESSDYYTPELGERAVAAENLPAPEPYIPEEVIAALVGDSMYLSDASPESEGLKSSYLEAPEVDAAGDEAEQRMLMPDLAEASPVFVDTLELVSADFPELPGDEDKYPIEVADGYISPADEDFEAAVTDFPDYKGSGEPVEIPETGDELVLTEVPAEIDETTAIPEMTEVPELAGEIVSADEEPAEGEPVVDEIEPAVPEYDENLEITLQPAEERPPELSEEEIALAEAEPETVMEETDAHAEHEPSIVGEAETEEPPEAAIVVERPESVETVIVPETAPETAAVQLRVPDKVVMADKLEESRHYLQLGAFRERNSALSAAGKLEKGYPVTILTDGGGASVSYKLLLGPLTADESGALLYNFRAGGYSDAFIRRIE